MKTVYLEEANELLDNLERALLQLDETPEEKKLIEEVFRIIHTLKGNSSMLGFTNIAEFIHNLETLYDQIREGEKLVSQELIDVTLVAMDHIKKIVDDPELADSFNKNQHKILGSQILALTGETYSQSESEIDTTKDINPEKNSSSTFYIHFKPAKSVVREGNNPLYLVDELFTLGECIALPYTDLPKDINKLNPTECTTGWSIFLATEKTENEIKDVFVFVEANSEILVEKVSDRNLLQDQSFKEQLATIDLKNSPLDLHTFNFNQVSQQSIESKKPAEDLDEKQLSSKVKEVKKSQTASVTKEKNISSIRVSSDKLDDLMNLVSELITTQAALSLLSDKNSDSELDGISENVEKLSRQLRDIAFGMTLVPINNMFGRFQRMVRDISKELGKDVAFINEGGETELDKSIIESLADPLMHILRNSLDHGIESKEQRLALGKSEKGTIVLRAYYSGTNVIIEIKDDGKGIDPDVIRAKAIEKEIIQEDTILSDKEIFNLVFHAGFSTAEVVTDVSGRGVGMDVVRRNISNLRGEVDIQSQVGEGTTLTISLPLSLSIIDGLLVELGQGSFVIPLTVIDKCYTHSDAKEINMFTKIMELDTEQIPYIDLREIFNIQDELDEKITRQIVVVNNGIGRVGIICDHIVGEYQAVIKPLGAYFKEQDYISGSTILGDGNIALVFDTNRLIKKYVAKQEDTTLS